MRFPLRISAAWRPVLYVFGMSQRASFADIDAGVLRVKAGIWFDETFPLGNVAEVSRSTWPWYGGLGVKLGPGDAVSVVGSSEGIVAVRFKQPQPMRVLFTVTRSELRLSLEDPDRFMRALREASGL